MNAITDSRMEEDVKKLRNEISTLKKQLNFLLSVVLANNGEMSEDICEILDQLDTREESWLEDMDLLGDMGYTM